MKFSLPVPFTEQKNTDPNPYASKFRWAFHCDYSNKMFSIGFEQEYFRDEWNVGRRYYDMNVTETWHLGRCHDYYDGPHDSFSIGPVHFCWQGDWCVKCSEGA